MDVEWTLNDWKSVLAVLCSRNFEFNAHLNKQNAHVAYVNDFKQ